MRLPHYILRVIHRILSYIRKDVNQLLLPYRFYSRVVLLVQKTYFWFLSLLWVFSAMIQLLHFLWWCLFSHLLRAMFIYCSRWSERKHFLDSLRSTNISDWSCMHKGFCSRVFIFYFSLPGFNITLPQPRLQLLYRLYFLYLLYLKVHVMPYILCHTITCSQSHFAELNIYFFCLSDPIPVKQHFVLLTSERYSWRLYFSSSIRNVWIKPIFWDQNHPFLWYGCW